jgi:hypothetical protein
MTAQRLLVAVVVSLAVGWLTPHAAAQPQPWQPFPIPSVIELLVFSDNAENGEGNWDIYDDNADGTPKYEYWGQTDVNDSETEAITGTYSYYSSRHSKTEIGGYEYDHGKNYQYADHMAAKMWLKDSNAFDLSGHDHGILEFDFRVSTNDFGDDFLCYMSNEQPAVFATKLPTDETHTSGHIAFRIGNTTTKIGFYFGSDGDLTRGHGALVDNIQVRPSDEIAEGIVLSHDDLILQFEGLSSMPGSTGAPIVDYLWSFGDGTYGSGPVVEHAYPAADLYRVELTVTDAAMNQGSTYFFVDAVPEPAALSLLALGGLALLRRRRGASS